MALSAEDKRKIRKEIQRRAQSKMAWKAGGGTTTKNQASMKGWSGFMTGADKKLQTDYIKLINKNKAFKEKTKAATKKGAAKGKAKVETYISKKGAGAAGKAPPVKKAGKKPKPGTAGNLTEGQQWYRRQKAKYGGDAAKMQKVRAMHKRKYGKK